MFGGNKFTDGSIQALSQSLKELQEINEEVERLRNLRREIFDAVTDPMWVFQSGRCSLLNRAAREVDARISMEPASFHTQLLDLSLKREYGGPALLRLDGRDQHPIVLELGRTTRLNLESGPGILVTAADLSLGFEMGERIQERKFEEQQRIARDLHDGLSQLLASLTFRLQALCLRNAGPEIGQMALEAELALEEAAQLHHRFAEKSNLRDIP